MLIFFPWLFRESILGSWNVSSLRFFSPSSLCKYESDLSLKVKKNLRAVWTLTKKTCCALKMRGLCSRIRVNKFQSRLFWMDSLITSWVVTFFNSEMNNACRSAFSCLKAYLFLSHWTLCLSDRTRYINSDADKKWVNWRTSLWCEKVQLMYQIKGVNF